MVRVSLKHVSWVSNARNRPDLNAGAAIDSTDRDVRYIGYDRSVIYRVSPSYSAQHLCQALMEDSITIMVRVIPKASKSEVVGLVDGHLKVRIAAPPVDGAANAELIKLLSRHFDVPKREIKIVSGVTSRVKKVRIGGVEEQAAQSFLNGHL